MRQASPVRADALPSAGEEGELCDPPGLAAFCPRVGEVDLESVGHVDRVQSQEERAVGLDLAALDSRVELPARNGRYATSG